MGKQIYEEMFENVVHIGHKTQKWNPLMKKYLYGEKNGIHIINLEKTNELLEKALEFVKKNVGEGKNILFVSTKPQSTSLIKKIATSTSMPYVTSKWISGLLTNFSTVKTRIKYMTDLTTKEASGELSKYTKKEVSKMKKELLKLDTALGGVKNLKGLPDAVFVVDVVRDLIVVEEARKLKIPVIALVDSNSNPKLVNFPIPANDDALKSLTYIMTKFEDAIKNSVRKPKSST